MKTPKETAVELVVQFTLHRTEIYTKLDSISTLISDKMNIKSAKQCALIAVKFAKENPFNTFAYKKYLNEVEAEIEKL